MKRLAVSPKLSIRTPHCFAKRSMPQMNSGMINVRSLLDKSRFFTFLPRSSVTQLSLMNNNSALDFTS